MMTTKTTVMNTSLWERKSIGSNDIYLNLTLKLNKNVILYNTLILIPKVVNVYEKRRFIFLIVDDNFM